MNEPPRTTCPPTGPEASAQAPATARPFSFERDTFAFANELHWEYRMDSATGKVSFSRNPEPHPYAHRCFVMVRAARQFFYHARFEPALPMHDHAVYRSLVQAVVRRDPRKASPEPARLVIPGFAGLREFSRAHESVLKAECGAAWRSYFVRSHWRMTFPIWRGHQARMAAQLFESFSERIAPIVHVFCFPRLSINHALVLFDLTPTPTGITFAAYDPNIPDHPAELFYDQAARSFSFPRNHYWAGGPLQVVEAYRGGLY